MEAMNGIVLVEVDQDTRELHYDRAEAWLKNLQLTQASFRQLLGDTIPSIAEPHFREYLNVMLGHALAHEKKAEQLFELIGRRPSAMRTVAGEIAGKGRQLIGDLIGLAGGVKGPWQDIHQLYLSNLNSMSAFAVAEQLGLALGIPAIPRITFPVIAEKSSDQLLLQELALEMCSMSILYKTGF